VPNSLARSLVGGQSHTIGLIIADMANPFYSKVTQGVEETARQHGYSTILVDTHEDDNDERQAVQVLRSKQVDGIIIHPAQASSDHIAGLLQLGIPTVLVNRYFPGLEIDCIINNNRHGACLAVRHLIELGHRRIAHITGPAQISSVCERISGYRQALEEAVIPFDESLIIHTALGLQAGCETGRSLFQSGLDFSAIYVYSDYLAVGVFKAARELGLHIPLDYSLVGYDDIEFAEFLETPLTTVRQPMYEIGQRAVLLLIENIENPGHVPGQKKIVLEPELVIRQSTAPPHDGG
jgi:LacI family transcriptional regulator